MTTQKGREAFEAVGAKLKSETEAEKVKEETAVAEIKNSLAAVQGNERLAKMYSENASVGTEDLVTGDTPVLKVHSVGRSQNELADGSEPHNGYFFYKPYKQEFKEIMAHILTISGGYYTDKMGGQPGDKTYQHLLAGVFKIDGDYVPFMTYLNSAGHRNRMYDFGKEVGQYTHMKPISIPMFAMTVKLFTTSEAYTYDSNGKKQSGKSWVINYEIQKGTDGFPIIVEDEGEFEYLKELTLKMKGVVASMIANAGKKNGETPATPVEAVDEALPGGNGVEEINF